MSFGFSPADIKEFLKLINWVHGSLREEGGSREDFQSLDQVQTTLQQVLDNASSSAQILTVSDADRDSLLKAVDVIRTRASSLSTKHAKFGKKFSSKKSASWHREILAKFEWMLEKDGHRLHQKDLLEQVNILSSQLSISGLKTVVQKVDETASLNEKLHNAHRDGAQSNKLELRDLIQTTGQKNQEITLRTSAGLLDRLAEIAADEQQFRGKLESELSSLQSTTFDSSSDISRTRWRLKDFHQDINQHMEAVVYDATARTRLMNSIRDDVADLHFRISQSMEQSSTKKEDSSTTVTPVSVPWIMAAVGVMVIHRHPQGQEILLKVSQAGVSDPISCLLVVYILFALYQLLRTRFLPRLTQSVSVGADCVFFQDPWGKTIKVPFSVGQDPLIMDNFAEAYFHTHNTICHRREEGFHWFTGPSEDSMVTWNNWQERVRPGVLLSMSLVYPLDDGIKCADCGYIWEDLPLYYHKPDCGKMPKQDLGTRERWMENPMILQIDQLVRITHSFFSNPLAVWTARGGGIPDFFKPLLESKWPEDWNFSIVDGGPLDRST